MKRKCPKCKKYFPPTLEFWGKGTHRGFQSYCRKCKTTDDRIYSREYRELNPEWKKEDNKKNRGLVSKLVNIWRRKNPEKLKAQTILNNAVKNGKLKRLPCLICGNEDGEGHHSNYSKPLFVKWLCPKHHKGLHYKLLTADELKLVESAI